MSEPCPDCGGPMTVENGLWYCPACDAYHGEAGEEEPEPAARAPYYVNLGVTDDEVARGDDYGRYDFPNLRRDR